MSDLFGRTNEDSSMDRELLKAMAAKMVDLLSSMKENTEQTRKLAEHMGEIGEVKERLASQEKRGEEQVRKEAAAAALIQQVGVKIDASMEKIESLQGSLQKHGQLFEKPLDKTVHYHHFLGKSFWILFGMVVITTCALSMMIWQWQRAGQYARDEMKWRFMKLCNDSTVVIMVERAESESQSEPDAFARGVGQEEDRRAELTKNILREQEARRRIEELEKQKVKK